ncbi:hypothetical protein FB451DRAFT_1164875 [Mycena latifolia]|nr:hypothetical protein FB451DRAFT_1164875 [Mycena latifolia]
MTSITRWDLRLLLRDAPQDAIPKPGYKQRKIKRYTARAQKEPPQCSFCGGPITAKFQPARKTLQNCNKFEGYRKAREDAHRHVVEHSGDESKRMRKSSEEEARKGSSRTPGEIDNQSYKVGQRGGEGGTRTQVIQAARPTKIMRDGVSTDRAPASARAEPDVAEFGMAKRVRTEGGATSTKEWLCACHIDAGRERFDRDRPDLSNLVNRTRAEEEPGAHEAAEGITPETIDVARLYLSLLTYRQCEEPYPSHRPSRTTPGIEPTMDWAPICQCLAGDMLSLLRLCVAPGGSILIHPASTFCCAPTSGRRLSIYSASFSPAGSLAVPSSPSLLPRAWADEFWMFRLHRRLYMRPKNKESQAARPNPESNGEPLRNIRNWDNRLQERSGHGDGECLGPRCNSPDEEKEPRGQNDPTPSRTGSLRGLSEVTRHQRQVHPHAIGSIYLEVELNISRAERGVQAVVSANKKIRCVRIIQTDPASNGFPPGIVAFLSKIPVALRTPSSLCIAVTAPG